MIKSMTGFGQAERQSSLGRTRVEIKSTNHKFFEISVRLPGPLAEFEETIRKTVASKLRRGKISVFISAPDPATTGGRLRLNEPLARDVHQKIRRLQSITGLKASADATLAEILRTPDVLTKDASADRRPLLSADLSKTLSASLESLNRSRAAEGRALEKDFSGRLTEMKKSLGVIRKRVPRVAKEFAKSLSSRMGDFLKNGELDRERLTVEVAQYVKNSDISEEVTRLQSHLDAMARALKENGELGRKLDFIAQEMLRETNTMGSKSSDTAIAGAVIALKGAIEKIREQAQNVE